jgi:hypothetical protein
MFACNDTENNLRYSGPKWYHVRYTDGPKTEVNPKLNLEVLHSEVSDSKLGKGNIYIN